MSETNVVLHHASTVVWHGSWVLSQELQKCIEALEMFIYRRLIKITWRDRVTNEKVLRLMTKE